MKVTDDRLVSFIDGLTKLRKVGIYLKEEQKTEKSKIKKHIKNLLEKVGCKKQKTTIITIANNKIVKIPDYIFDIVSNNPVNDIINNNETFSALNIIANTGRKVGVRFYIDESFDIKKQSNALVEIGFSENHQILNFIANCKPISNS